MIDTPVQKMRASLRELDAAEECVDAVLLYALDCGDGAAIACLGALHAIQEAQRIVRANLAAEKDQRTAEEVLISAGIPADFAAMAVARNKR